MSNGYIKLDRRLLDWEWKDDPNMVALWIEILLQANFKEHNYHGDYFEPGTFPTSVEKLSRATGLTVRQVRTCLERLKKTKELTIESTNKGTKICVVKWAQYQGQYPESDKQNDKRTTNERQAIDNSLRKKESKNERDIYKDVDVLKTMGFEDEADKILVYCSIYSPSYNDYLKIKEAVFDPNVRHIDQYVKAIMKGQYEQFDTNGQIN